MAKIKNTLTFKMPRTVKRRKSYDERTRANSRASQITVRNLEPVYETDETTGQRTRMFTAENYCSADDVRHWLLKNRVVEIEGALEYVSKGVLRWLIKEGYLSADPEAAFFWVTVSAAAKYDLPRVLGCEFPA